MEYKQMILNRMLNVLKGQAMFVKEDKMLTDEQKLEQINVIYDLTQWVKSYDECKSVIEQHQKAKRKILGREE